jgi:hypothetical protein
MRSRSISQLIDLLQAFIRYLAHDIPTIFSSLTTVDEAKLCKMIGAMRHRRTQSTLILSYRRGLKRLPGKSEPAQNSKLLKRQATRGLGFLSNEIVCPTNRNVLPQLH